MSIIRIIKSASNPNDAKDQLMEKSWSCSDIANLIKLVDDKAIIGADGKIHLTEAQAKAILEMRLQRLTAMEKIS